MFAAHLERTRRAVYFRGTIGCQACRGPIHIHRISALADEFSVRCPKCGTRGIYDKRVMAVEEVPERRRKPRN